jgi:hypothetical protein
MGGSELGSYCRIAGSTDAWDSHRGRLGQKLANHYRDHPAIFGATRAYQTRGDWQGSLGIIPLNSCLTAADCLSKWLMIRTLLQIAVTRDDLHTGMVLQPGSEGRSTRIGKQLKWTIGAEVDQDGFEIQLWPLFAL